MGSLVSLWRSKSLSTAAEDGMLEGMVDSIMLYNSEIWMVLNVMERRRMEAFNKKWLRRTLEVKVMDRIRN